MTTAANQESQLLKQLVEQAACLNCMMATMLNEQRATNDLLRKLIGVDQQTSEHLRGILKKGTFALALARGVLTMTGSCPTIKEDQTL